MKIKLMKKPAPPIELPEEAELVGYSNSDDGSYVVIADSDGKEYEMTYFKMLEYYEIEGMGEWE